jgi:hypothetical protein
MLAEFHLAEDAFALHLLLQRSEGLVDIVVADKNLHAVFLSIRETKRRLWTVPMPMATVVRIPCGAAQRRCSSQIITISWAAAKLIKYESYLENGKMKIITTWHCTEVLQGEERGATPREWLILVGPGEDLIFEVKTDWEPTNKPDQPPARH